MSGIQWSDKLSLGVEKIDDQHKKLIRIANELINAIHLGHDEETVKNVINKLREYTVFHFNDEEQLMGDVHYDKRAEHAEEHERLNRSVQEIQLMISHQESLAPNDLRDFIKQWLLNHILTFDRGLARFIHDQESEKKQVMTGKKTAGGPSSGDLPQIHWSEQLSLGVEQIDNQHRELIGIANELIKAVAQGQTKDSVDDVVKKLREYTVFHFSSEEDLMEKIRYPGRGEQMQEHKRLKREVKEYQRQVYHREEVTPEAILEFVKEWLLKHILAYDRELAEFIHGQEAEETMKKIEEDTTS